MSSHHIVRDFQEPALLIADGEMCRIELLEQLLGWSPVIVALDEALPKLVELGIKVDYWLGDFDGINPESILTEIGQDTIQIVHRPDQNKTDLDKGLEFLIELGAEAVNILWATGKRMDHALANYSSVLHYSNRIKAVLWNDWSKAFIIPKSFSKWYPEGKIISLIPLPEAGGINTKGLQYELANGSLRFGERTGSSNSCSKDGKVEIEYTQGTLLLIEASDVPTIL